MTAVPRSSDWSHRSDSENLVLCVWSQPLGRHHGLYMPGKVSGDFFFFLITPSHILFPKAVLDTQSFSTLSSAHHFPSSFLSSLGHRCASPAFSAPEFSPSSHIYIFISLGKQFSSDLEAPILHPHSQHLTTCSSSQLKNQTKPQTIAL